MNILNGNPLALWLLGSIGIFAVGSWCKGFLARRLTTRETDDLAFSRIAVTHANDGLLVMDMAGIVQWVNPAYCKLFGRNADEMIGRHPRSFALVPDEMPDRAQIDAFRFDEVAVRETGLENFKNQRKDGTVFWNQISTSFHTAPSGTRYAVSVCRDVTQSIERENRLRETTRKLTYTATHDTLTGLANRSALTEFMTSALARSTAEGTHVGLLHIDLDNFKLINDSNGHAAGDAVLVAVAQRIQSHVRATDMAARIGGDEFVVVYPGLSKITDIQAIAGELLRMVNRPVKWNDRRLDCQISIGAVLSESANLSADALLKRSDFALYEVKRAGRGRVATYNKRLHDNYTHNATLTSDLRRAIESNALDFHFQPIVNAQTRIVESIETLAFWRHPKDGIIASPDFIPLARSIGLLAHIDRQAAAAALRLKTRINALGQNDITVMFTASDKSMADDQFVPDLAAELRHHGRVQGECVVAIRETSNLTGGDLNSAVNTTLRALQGIGVRTVLDNFARHHAGMIHLAKLQVDGVKLDGRRVQSALDDPEILRVFAMTMTLCNELDLTVTADGITSRELANTMTELGCQTLQGEWIAPAMPEKAVLHWIAQTTDCPRAAPPLSKGELRA